MENAEKFYFHDEVPKNAGAGGCEKTNFDCHHEGNVFESLAKLGRFENHFLSRRKLNVDDDWESSDDNALDEGAFEAPMSTNLGSRDVKCRKEAPVVIVISSDDESSTSSDESELYNPYSNCNKAQSMDDKTNSKCLEEGNAIYKKKYETSIKSYMNPNRTFLELGQTSLRWKTNKDLCRVKTKKSCDPPKVDLGNSPIGKAFYAKAGNKNSDVFDKMGVSVPLQSRLNDPPNCTSLQPRGFTNCQLDLLDGLAEDSMFHEAYISAVSSFASQTIAPPQQVVMHMLSNVATSSSERPSRKAINNLKRLLSNRTLSYRNIPLTWEIVCDAFQKLINDAKCFVEIEARVSEESSQESSRNSNDCSLFRSIRNFLFILNLFEQDFTRYRNNVRNAILWKVVSPSVYGNARLRTVGEWFLKVNILEEGSLDGLNTTPLSPLVITKALQRLVNLMFLSSRDTKAFGQDVAEMYLNCFFEIRTLKLRKELLLSIESVLVQRLTAELILSTISEDTDRSLEYQNRNISLETIIFGYFYKTPPHKRENGHADMVEEVTEEFVFLLYLLVRSYLTITLGCARNHLSDLSILKPEGACESVEQLLPRRDREVLLIVSEEIPLLRHRLSHYQGYGELGNRTEMYLSLLTKLLYRALVSSFP